jgi:signal transduction histidine kinase
MMAAGEGAMWQVLSRPWTGRTADPDAVALSRVGWRLAGLTVGLIAFLLLVLGGAVFATMQNFLWQSLQTNVSNTTIDTLRHYSRRIPPDVGDVHFIVADQKLNVDAGGNPYSPTTLPDPNAARKALAGRLTSHWSEQQVNASGPYLIYTLAVSLTFASGPPGGPSSGGPFGASPTSQPAATSPGVLQAYISERQYRDGRQLLLSILLGVSGAGLLSAAAISVVLTRRALAPIQLSLRRQRDFVADAAHELRTPLAIQRTAMELGLATDSVAEQQGVIEQVLSENVHLTRLVDSLSLLARADSGAVTLERARVDLAHLTNETAAGVAILAEERDVRLRVEAPSEAWVIGDAGRLRQVLLILLDNALKFTPDGGSITVGVARQGGQIRLEVRDSGPGIAPGDLPHLFERFYRADKARSSSGTGLGLAIGRWIVEAHGGRISAANLPEGGALFTVTLPSA